MKDDTPSWTAEAAAAIRARESLLPEEARLFEDEEDLPEAELNERYLTPRGRRLATMQGARIATAVVP